MCIKKIRLFHKRYLKRCRNFYSSSIAGLLTGTAIGIFFSLITDVSFDRWINIFSIELFAAIIYFMFVFFILFVFYFIGKYGVWFFISKNKDDLVGFKINYFASIYSASWAASLIILHSKILVAIYVSIVYLILYLPLEYFTVRTKRPK